MISKLSILSALFLTVACFISSNTACVVSCQLGFKQVGSWCINTDSLLTETSDPNAICSALSDSTVFDPSVWSKADLDLLALNYVQNPRISPKTRISNSIYVNAKETSNSDNSITKFTFASGVSLDCNDEQFCNGQCSSSNSFLLWSSAGKCFSNVPQVSGNLLCQIPICKLKRDIPMIKSKRAMKLQRKT